jgi:predicted permease
MGALIQDLRFAVRFLVRHKRTTAGAIVCLALGICVTTTVFGTANAWIFRPLPWESPEELVDINSTQPKHQRMNLPLSGPDYRDLRRENRVFKEMAAYWRTNLNLSSDDEPQRIAGARVSASLFPLLREQPILGRGFLEEEDLEGRGDVIVLGHDLWQRHFAGDPNVVGRTLRIDGRSHTIVGVMRPRFAFPEWAQAWTPLALATDGSGRGVHDLEAVARLRPGVSIEQAAADLGAIARDLEARHPDTNSGWGVRVQSYRDELIPAGVAKGLSLQLAASLFVLLIACANAANLLLAQSAQRHKEIALRTALGASRARIVRQLLTESTLIAAVAGAIGAALTPPLTDLLLTLSPLEPPYWVQMGWDAQVLAFTIVVSLATGIVFGLVPALRASRADLVATLKEEGRGATRGLQHNRLSRALVAAELSLSIVLLVCATLMVRSYLALQRVDLGYETSGVLTWQLTLTGSAYESEPQRARFVRDLVQRVESLPGVQAAGAVNFLPAGTGGYAQRSFEIEGRPVEVSERPFTGFQTVTSGFLRTLGVRLLEGRGLTRDDVENARDVALVSRSFAERFWPGESALDRRLRLGLDGPWRRVVGVTGDIREPFDLTGSEGRPDWQVWVPLPASVPEAVSFALRRGDDPAAAAPLVRRAVAGLDPDLPIYGVLTLEQVVFRVIWVSRMFSVMFAGLAVFALVLASIGLYGVISYTVAQRTHEVGVRMALGAQPGAVLGLIMRQGLGLTLVGTAVGLAIAAVAARGLASLLWGVEPFDALAFLGTTALLAGVSLLATFVPARRATRIDPIVALRSG